MTTLAPESPALAPSALPESIPHDRAHGLRTPTYQDLCRILEQPNPRIYLFNSVDQEWVICKLTHVDPPMPWGKKDAALWLSFPLRNGRRPHEDDALVRYDCGNGKGYVMLEDCRIPKTGGRQ